jgi:hypothetical protein
MNRGSKCLFVGCILTLAALIVWIRFAGCVVETEISLNSLEKRKKEYYVIPIFNLHVSAIKVTTIDSPLSRHLRSSGLVVDRTESERWVVANKHMGTHWRPRNGPANGLWRALRDQNAWLEWSQRRPDLAGVLWPRVLSMLDQGVDCEYVAVLLRSIDQQEDSVDQLHKRIDDVIQMVQEEENVTILK